MLEFYTKYYKGAIDSNFQRKYERLFKALNVRIEYEENILFNEYNMLNLQQNAGGNVL